MTTRRKFLTGVACLPCVLALPAVATGFDWDMVPYDTGPFHVVSTGPLPAGLAIPQGVTKVHIISQTSWPDGIYRVDDDGGLVHEI